MITIPTPICRSALGVALFWLAAGPVLAQQPSQAQIDAVRSSCRSDFMSKCRGVTPGGVDALQCLKRNIASLSAGCQGAVNALQPVAAPAPAAKPEAAPAPAAAAAPAVAVPPPVHATATATPVTVAVPAAPQAKSANPKPMAARPSAAKPDTKPDAAPKANLAATSPVMTPDPAPEAPIVTPQQRSAIQRTCRGDFRRNCRGIPPGGAEAMACLQTSAARLSPDCKIAVADAMPGSGPSPGAISGGGIPPAMPPAVTSDPGARPVGPIRQRIRERARERIEERRMMNQ